MIARSLLVVSLLSLSACAFSGAVDAPRSTQGVQTVGRQAPVSAACPNHNQPGFVYCEALVRTDVRSDAPSGYAPSDLQSAYALPSTTNGSGQTIAIVDAFDDPNAEADMYMYRNTFGLPVCSTLNHCFKKVNQRGKRGPLPKPNGDWSTEISVDIDMVSAGCPNCNILLVESSEDTWKSIEIAVNTAVRLGAHIVSNSYGDIGGGNPKVYDHPGVVMLASGGDAGYTGHRNHNPSDFPSVVSVGGTRLLKGGGSRGWSETVWAGSGSGCSKFAKPAWQTDTGCTHRTANDVAAVADPSTGVAVYDSYQNSGWMQIGGTSVGTPLNAAAFALAGNASQQNAASGFYQAQNQQYLNDVTAGSNGTCSPAYLCNGETGYDGPTGWGTPNGIGAY